MISVGNRDANNGLGLGLGLAGVGGGLGGREMEETELEEGEACSYNNDNAGAIDPDVALSYLVRVSFLLSIFIIRLLEIL